MRYPGGKNGAGVYQWIVRHMPRHDFFVEGFAGSAAVSRHKPAAELTVLIEKDDQQFNRLANYLETPSSDSTLTATSVRNDDRIRKFNCSFLQWLARNERRLTKGWLLYLDPPYLNCYGHYRCEMTPAQHKKLLIRLQNLPCHVMISGYFSDLYADHLRDWHLVTRWCMTRGGLREEHLWMNYTPEPGNVLTTLHNGDNFRERQRVKRKAERWKQNFESLPQWERQYILESLLAD